jgi:hypothetical protein
MEVRDMSLLKSSIVISMLMTAFSASAFAAEAEVVFTGRIAKDLSRIDNLELVREKFFRKNRREGVGKFERSRIRAGLFVKAEFANERLIPNIDDFSIQALANAMATYSFDKEPQRTPGENLKVEIENFSIISYSLARYSQGPTRMKGKVSVLDDAGNVIRTVDVFHAMVPRWTNNRSYDGAEYAYARDSGNVRIAPMIASFIEQGLEELYPGSDVPGPIFIQ